jgi:signal-transduction protein with cAMP-binding, CBS, and nucleotidyltransferase domain
MNIEKLLIDNNVPKDALLELRNVFKGEKIKKNEYFIRYGKKMNKIGILYDGILVSRFSDSKGKEVASKFYFPKGDKLVVDYYSFVNQLNSEEEIQAIENSILLVINYTDYKKLSEKYSFFDRLIKKFAEESYLKALKRIRDFQLLKAKERIENFNKTHKEIINKLKITDKSSYLGVSRNIYTINLKKIQ